MGDAAEQATKLHGGEPEEVRRLRCDLDGDLATAGRRDAGRRAAAAAARGPATDGRADALALPGAVPGALPRVRDRAGRLRLLDQPAPLRLHAARQAVRRPRQLRQPVRPRRRCSASSGRMRATGIFTVLSVPPLLVIPLLVALVMNRKFPGATCARRVLRAVRARCGRRGRAVALPARHQHRAGQLLHGPRGLPDDIAWTTSVPAAWVALVGVTVWWTLGFNSVIYLAGLQDIPGSSTRRPDGRRQRVAAVRPRHACRACARCCFVTMVTIIASVNMFGQSTSSPRGRPGRDPHGDLPDRRDRPAQYQMGDPAAMSYVLTLFLMVLSVVVFRLFREQDA